jgi:hypothetical protein
MTLLLGITSSNDALSINLVAPSTSGLKLCGTFHPKFTYSIFGDDERIVGYKDPRVNLRFRANDMRPHLNVSYGKKMKAIGESEPTDIKGLLENGGHLPKGLSLPSFEHGHLKFANPSQSHLSREAISKTAHNSWLIIGHLPENSTRKSSEKTLNTRYGEAA